MLLAVVVAMIELTRVYDVQNLLEISAREGARFAALDRTGILEEGESANSKMIQDVTNFMASSGIPSENVQVNIPRCGKPLPNLRFGRPSQRPSVICCRG